MFIVLSVLGFMVGAAFGWPGLVGAFIFMMLIDSGRSAPEPVEINNHFVVYMCNEDDSVES